MERAHLTGQMIADPPHALVICTLTHNVPVLQGQWKETAQFYSRTLHRVKGGWWQEVCYFCKVNTVTQGKLKSTTIVVEFF